MQKAQFRSFCAEIDVLQFTDFREYLKSIFNHIKSNYSGTWSIISFSEKLGLGSSNSYYLMVTNRRKPNPQSIKTMASSIGLKGLERKYFKTMVDFQLAKSDEERQKKFKTLASLKKASLDGEQNKVALDFFGEWYYSAIFEIMSLDNASDSPEWLAKFIVPGVTEAKIEKALKLMKKIGLLTFNKNLNRLAPTNKSINTGPDTYGIVFQSYHQKMLELATKALVNGDPDQRNISSITISVSKENYSEIVRMIDEFQTRLDQLSNEPQKKEQVFQINTQLFALSKITGKNK